MDNKAAYLFKLRSTISLFTVVSAHNLAEINKSIRTNLIEKKPRVFQNWKSLRTKHVVKLLQGATRRILLTGTPALARPEEVRLSNARKFLETEVWSPLVQ